MRKPPRFLFATLLQGIRYGPWFALRQRSFRPFPLLSPILPTFPGPSLPPTGPLDPPCHFLAGAVSFFHRFFFLSVVLRSFSDRPRSVRPLYRSSGGHAFLFPRRNSGLLVISAHHWFPNFLHVPLEGKVGMSAWTLKVREIYLLFYG